MENKTLKNLKLKNKKSRYLKEYGLEILHLLLKKDGFNFCSFSNKGIPTNGSETLPIYKCNQPMYHEVNKIVFHTKEDKITLFTNAGNIQYLKL